MSRIAIITDSTANIPEEFVRDFSLKILPQTLIWESKSYRDGIDISPNTFYERLKTSKAIPSTAQVTPQMYENACKELLDQDYSVIVITISDGMSGTLASALEAAKSFPGAPLAVVDSRTASLAECLVVLSVAEAVHSGADFKEAVKLAEYASSQVGIIFAVETLEFLHRGGRISGSSRLMGTMLNVKPILEVIDGKIQPSERVRTRRKSISRLIELANERIGDRGPVRLGVIHAACEEEARLLLKRAEAQIPSERTIFSEISPVIGAHTGPGTIGLAWLPLQ